MRFDKSHEWLAQSRVIPGCSLTRSKVPGKFFEVGRGPLFASSAGGATLVDVDGNVFIDMLCAMGAVGLGYRAGPQGHAAAVYSLPHPLEAVAANAVLEHVAPWASHARFLKTGSEATHAAYRIAKRATGRKYVLMGDWAYHGWHEWCERRPDGRMESDTTLAFGHGVLPEYFLDETGRGVEPDEVAAIFVEPHRWEAVSRAWLQQLRDYCDRHRIVLVFDEMIYGARWALGGASEYFGVKPDLACFGKAIGNGHAVACVVGSALLRDYGQLPSGTYSGEVAALEAVSNVVSTYADQPVIKRIWELGSLLRDGLDSIVDKDGPVVGRDGEPVHQRLRFRDDATGLAFGAEMAARGVLIHPACINLCYAHEDAQVYHVIDAARDSAAALRKAVAL